MSEADGGAPRPMPKPTGLWRPPYRRLTAGLLLVVAAAAFESLAVATILPLVVRDLGGLALYGWAFSLFTLANLLGITLGGVRRIGGVRPHHRRRGSGCFSSAWRGVAWHRLWLC